MFPSLKQKFGSHTNLFHEVKLHLILGAFQTRGHMLIIFIIYISFTKAIKNYTLQVIITILINKANSEISTQDP